MAILAVASWAGPLGRQVGTSVLDAGDRDRAADDARAAVGDPQPLSQPPLWLRLPLQRPARAARRGPAGHRAAVDVPGLLRATRGHVRGDLGRGHRAGARGWGLFYGLLLVATVFALEAIFPPTRCYSASLAIIVIGCVDRRFARATNTPSEPAGRMGRALWAGAMGAALGGLLVGDSSLGWGVHGAFPALALLPSVFGSFWGGYHLWQFYDAVPRGLQGAGLERANKRDAARCCDASLPGRNGAPRRHDRRALRGGHRDLAMDVGHQPPEPVRRLWLRGAAARC